MASVNEAARPRHDSRSEAESKPSPARRAPRGLVLIAGGGIGGIAAALALSRRGIASHVLEKRPLGDETGAGIQLGPNGTRILTALGVAPHLAPVVSEPDALVVMDGVRGRQIQRLPLGRWIESRHGAPYWVAHRADLHAALLAQARAEPLVRLSFASSVTSLEEGPFSVRAVLGPGRSEESSVLVAADGLWSNLRRHVNPSASPRPAGKSAARAIVPADALPKGLEPNAVHIWLAPKAHIVHYPVRRGSEIALIVVVDDGDTGESWSMPVLPGWIAERTGSFPPPLRSLLAAPRSWRKWSLFRGPRLDGWTRGRVALLGDAAHPVLPFLAQGAVLALEDAVVLADTLAAADERVPAALAEYGRARRVRAARVAGASARNGTIYHLDGLLAAARNRVLAALPPERTMAGLDWLYGWRHPPSTGAT